MDKKTLIKALKWTALLIGAVVFGASLIMTYVNTPLCDPMIGLDRMPTHVNCR